MKAVQLPRTHLEAIRYFGDEENAHAFMVQMRWPNGVTCPHCQSQNVGKLSCSETTKKDGTRNVRRVWNCKGCKKQFTAKVGTVFEDSPLPLSKWLPAVWLITNAKNGISSCELGRSLGITQKSAWFMLHRIRTAMQQGGFEKLKGVVEADESFIGGKGHNMHRSRRNRAITPGARGWTGKSIVMGMLERGGVVKVKHVRNNKRHTVQGEIRENVEAGANIHTDALKSYIGLEADYVHQVVDHAITYVQGNCHTNGLENFWSLLKRTLKGTYVSVDPVHLFRYLDEQVNRYNNRKLDDGERFNNVVGSLAGKRVTWNQLTGHAQTAA